MKSTLLFLFVVLISLACFTHFASAADPMDAAKTAWANTPHGQVWLNPGDAYEHNTGLVRDAAGFHRHPNSSVQRSFPMYNHSPQPRYHVPSYVAPFYPTYPTAHPFDTGPYVAPPHYAPRSCPNCRSPNRRPSTHGWGIGSIDPMDEMKTGDAPLRSGY